MLELLMTPLISINGETTSIVALMADWRMFNAGFLFFLLKNQFFHVFLRVGVLLATSARNYTNTDTDLMV